MTNLPQGTVSSMALLAALVIATVGGGINLVAPRSAPAGDSDAAVGYCPSGINVTLM
jgi:hypothetical protein